MAGRVFLTGDIHGNPSRLSSKKWPVGKTLTKDDVVIVLGDFGLLWYPPSHPSYKEDQYWLNWLDGKPWTTLWVQGNHENYDLIKLQPSVPMFGAKVRQTYGSVYMLERGEVYTIGGKDMLALGGATSIDKARRVPGVSWWPDEEFSYKDIEKTLDNMERLRYSVSYILSHEGPTEAQPDLYKRTIVSPTTNSCNMIAENVDFKHWYFGHHHVDYEAHKFTCLYKSVIELGGALCPQ